MTEDEFRRQMSTGLPMGRNKMRPLSDFKVTTIRHDKKIVSNQFELLLDLWRRTGIIPKPPC